MPKDLQIIQLQKAPDATIGEVSPTIRTNRFVTLRQMGSATKTVSGIHKLAQFITKLLLTTQGTDKFDVDYGSSLSYLLRDPRSLAELRDIQGQVGLHMRDVKKQIIRSQINLSLPADERLKDLQLIRVDFDEDELKYDIDLKLISDAGDEREINLGDLVVEEVP